MDVTEMDQICVTDVRRDTYSETSYVLVSSNSTINSVQIILYQNVNALLTVVYV